MPFVQPIETPVPETVSYEDSADGESNCAMALGPGLTIETATLHAIIS